MDDVTVLFRSVGMAEYALLVRGGFRAWPTRSLDQPIFHLVSTERHAAQLARDWHVKDVASGYVGYVTRVAVRTAFLARFPLRSGGPGGGQEYWIPTEHLAALNRNLVGPIEVVAEFRPVGGQERID